MLESPSPETLPKDLREIYSRRFQGNLDYRNRVWQTLTANFFSRWIRPADRVLDLGCGYCQFINHIECAEKYGMDLNPSAADHAAKDVTLLQQDCSTRWPFDANFLDAVFTSNFLEHLPTKGALENTLLEAMRCLKPGGKLIALGPNIRYLASHYWDFFDHHLALSDRSLVEVLEKTGFAVAESIPRFLPYTMVRSRKYPDIFLRVYLRVRLAWLLFGKQFLIVVTKPDQSSRLPERLTAGSHPPAGNA
jgi:SAM-dependent methyltransferase